MDGSEVRRRMYRSPTPRERKRWHALWLLGRGWTDAPVARALHRDDLAICQWAKVLAEGGWQLLRS